jgi:hypothetical protein
MNDLGQPRINVSRRRAIAKLGAFAAYTAPALTSLLVGRDAHADHPGHGNPPCNTPNPPDPLCGSEGAQADTPEVTRVAGRSPASAARVSART